LNIYIYVLKWDKYLLFVTTPVVPQSYLRQKLRDIDSTTDGALTHAHSEITCPFWATICASLQTGEIKLYGYKKPIRATTGS